MWTGRWASDPGCRDPAGPQGSRGLPLHYSERERRLLSVPSPRGAESSHYRPFERIRDQAIAPRADRARVTVCNSGGRSTMTTLADVAAQAGVSMMTVSNVLAGKKNKVSAKTAERVMAAVEATGYVPSG